MTELRYTRLPCERHGIHEALALVLESVLALSEGGHCRWVRGTHPPSHTVLLWQYVETSKYMKSTLLSLNLTSVPRSDSIDIPKISILDNM